MATRIGIDIGGTFTDLVFEDEDTGTTHDGKVPTVPHASSCRCSRRQRLRLRGWGPT